MRVAAVRRWLWKWWHATGRSRSGDPRRLTYELAMNLQAKLFIFALVMIPASLNGRLAGLSTEQAVLGGGGAIAVSVLHYLFAVLPARRRLRKLGLRPDDF